jgi:Thioesterase superfamily
VGGARPGQADDPTRADQSRRAARRSGRLRDGRLLDGLVLWQARRSGERIATIGISINYVQTARDGDVVCTSTLNRRNDRVAILESEVRHGDGRLLATAIGSFAIFPKERLGRHDRGPAVPGELA